MQTIALKSHTVPAGEYTATWSGYELRTPAGTAPTVAGIRGAAKYRVRLDAGEATVLEDLGPANPWER